VPEILDNTGTPITLSVVSKDSRDYNDLIRYDSSFGILYLNPQSLMPRSYSFLVIISNGVG
jgi:hypothetical protein